MLIFIELIPNFVHFIGLNMNTEVFAARHIGITERDLPHMLQTIGVENIEQLIYETIPDDIKLKKPLDLPEGISEHEFLSHLNSLAKKTIIIQPCRTGK